jgi:2-C-methyl-D-erythritol 4-phosphate cytidylyltransferase
VNRTRFVSEPSVDSVKTRQDLRVGVVVPAAGLAKRMEGERKQFFKLAGERILLLALNPLLVHPAVQIVVVALPADQANDPPYWLTNEDDRIQVVRGGDTRRNSVWAGLKTLPSNINVVVIHDGARPLVSPDVVARCIDVAAGGVGAVAGFRVVDTMKIINQAGGITETLERSKLWHAQTPQAFPRAQILKAYQRAVNENWSATDDAAIVEKYGGDVVMVESSPTNLKITCKDDIKIAEAILNRTES